MVYLTIFWKDVKELFIVLTFGKIPVVFELNRWWEEDIGILFYTFHCFSILPLQE